MSRMDTDTGGLPERPYRLFGEVVHGKGLGRGVGMPTANIRVRKGTALPASGVYASVTRVPRGGCGNPESGVYTGLTHIGARPTVDDSAEITVENHIFDFSGDLYTREVVIYLCLYIRETRKFGGLREVKEQVACDARVARGFFSGMTHGFYGIAHGFNEITHGFDEIAPGENAAGKMKTSGNE